ncbi:MAG: histidine phosphatase family protein [Rhodoblastus sp.]
MTQKLGAAFNTDQKPPGLDDFVATRFWWVRHAPVRVDNGCIYGQRDLPCDCSDTHVFEGLARSLPAGAVWATSNLGRAKQTAAAIFAAGHPDAAAYAANAPVAMAEFAEQNLGDWQGLNRIEFFRNVKPSPAGHWFNPPEERAPNGESFVDLIERTRTGIEQLATAHASRDIVVVAHGGTIRAAIGIALNLAPRSMMAFTTDNCSVTRLDILRNARESGWRVLMANHQPWIGAGGGEAKLA